MGLWSSDVKFPIHITPLSDKSINWLPSGVYLNHCQFSLNYFLYDMGSYVFNVHIRVSVIERIYLCFILSLSSHRLHQSLMLLSYVKSGVDVWGGCTLICRLYYIYPRTAELLFPLQTYCLVSLVVILRYLVISMQCCFKALNIPVVGHVYILSSFGLR